MKIKREALSTLFNWSEIFGIFLIGFFLVVIRPLGLDLSRMPGDLGDARFNNYILEHDFRWITGQDSSLLNAPFFYPYPQTLTFSDNHFGSMFFYDGFRLLGLDRESSFQAWYLFSYILCFSAATYVLRKINLKPLAIGIGAFFFTFGLPMIAQEGHAQLAFRFCIPLACYSLWSFSQKPKIKHLIFTLFWLAWQFYLSIYLGYFLSLLLIVLAIGSPLIQTKNIYGILQYWPKSLKDAWNSSRVKYNIIAKSASNRTAIPEQIAQ